MHMNAALRCVWRRHGSYVCVRERFMCAHTNLSHTRCRNVPHITYAPQNTATHALQNTAIHTATHCNTHCNTLQHTECPAHYVRLFKIAVNIYGRTHMNAAWCIWIFHICDACDSVTHMSLTHMSLTHMSLTHMSAFQHHSQNKSCHIWMSRVTYTGFTRHIWMSHVTRECLTCHIWMSHKKTSRTSRTHTQNHSQNYSPEIATRSRWRTCSMSTCMTIYINAAWHIWMTHTHGRTMSRNSYMHFENCCQKHCPKIAMWRTEDMYGSHVHDDIYECDMAQLNSSHSW